MRKTAETPAAPVSPGAAGLTREELTESLAGLEAQEQKLRNDLIAVGGARQIVTQLLARLEAKATT